MQLVSVSDDAESADSGSDVGCGTYSFGSDADPVVVGDCAGSCGYLDSWDIGVFVCDAFARCDGLVAVSVGYDGGWYVGVVREFGVPYVEVFGVSDDSHWDDVFLGDDALGGGSSIDLNLLCYNSYSELCA